MLDQRKRDIAAGKRFLGPQQLRPDVMYLALPHSKGFDFDSGFGFVDASVALRLTAGF